MQLQILPARPEKSAALLSNHSYVVSGPGWCHEKMETEDYVCRISRIIARLPRRWLQEVMLPKRSILDLSSKGLEQEKSKYVRQT